jgi:hypothetical protein
MQLQVPNDSVLQAGTFMSAFCRACTPAGRLMGPKKLDPAGGPDCGWAGRGLAAPGAPAAEDTGPAALESEGAAWSRRDAPRSTALASSMDGVPPRLPLLLWNWVQTRHL